MPPPRKPRHKSRRKSQPRTPPSYTPSSAPADASPSHPLLAQPPTDSRALWIQYAALCLLVAASYLPVTWAGWVWDDATITGAPDVIKWSGIWNIWFSPGAIYQEAHYWPVVYTTFWLEHKLWGFNPLGYHLINVALHAANVVLLYRLLCHLTVPAAWVAAAVFAVHPLHVESVVWVIERKDVLSALFYFCAVGMYIRFIERGDRRRYVATIGLYLLALLSKSIVVTLPAALLVWHWWKHGRITVQDWIRMLPFFVLGLLISIGDLALAFSTETIISTFTVQDRILMAARALWFYPEKLLLPINQAVVYDIRIGNWGHAVTVGAVLIALWALQRQLGRGALAGVLFFVLTISPTIGFVDYGFMRFAFVADRFQYLAGIGVIATVTVGAARVIAWFSPAKIHAVVAGICMLTVLSVLSTLTWRHAENYRNPEALFSHIVSQNPRAEGANYNLANEYKKQGRLREAMRYYKIALRHDPRSADTYNQIGLILIEFDKPAEAEEHFNRALAIKPDYTKGLINLAVLRVDQMRYQDALALYQRAIQLDGNAVAAHSGLGAVLRALGRLEEALASFDRALTIDPTFSHALTNRAAVLRALQN